jgi:hypothetical protein
VAIVGIGVLEIRQIWAKAKEYYRSDLWVDYFFSSAFIDGIFLYGLRVI